MKNSDKTIFLADGFPRNQENLDVWNKRMEGKVDVQFLLLFDLEGETMLKRLLYRASQSKVKRDDDKEEVMKKRIATFEKSLPIFEIFEISDFWESSFNLCYSSFSNYILFSCLSIIIA